MKQRHQGVFPDKLIAVLCDCVNQKLHSFHGNDDFSLQVLFCDWFGQGGSSTEKQPNGSCAKLLIRKKIKNEQQYSNITSLWYDLIPRTVQISDSIIMGEKASSTLLRLRLLFLFLCTFALGLMWNNLRNVSSEEKLSWIDFSDLETVLDTKRQQRQHNELPAHTHAEEQYGEIKPCQDLDVDEAQAIELKTSCANENLSRIETDHHVVICNVDPVFKNDVNRTLLLPKAVGKLRHNWTHNPPLSPFAQAIEKHQSNCVLPFHTFHLDNVFGIGSHIALWSQAVCNAMEAGYRLRTYNPTWLWLDQTFCSLEVARKSPWLCYLPRSEILCGCSEPVTSPAMNASDPRDLKRHQCALLKGKGEDILREFRAASTEFLFRRVAPLVIQEAQRQVGLLFGPSGTPDDLITVHIRWGDKFWEMPNRTLVAIETYFAAISSLLHEQQGHNQTANIYLATEDPRAYHEFQSASPTRWTVYFDRTVVELERFRPVKGNRASHMALNSKGRAGLAGFASLLVAMEARSFVLTTRSNWSRVIDHLRRNIIDPRCNGCTKMVDLVSGLW